MRFEPLAFFSSSASEARRSAIDSKAIPVLHERMAHVAELGLPPFRLAVELGFGVGRALMRVVIIGRESSSHHRFSWFASA